MLNLVVRKVTARPLKVHVAKTAELYHKERQCWTECQCAILTNADYNRTCACFTFPSSILTGKSLRHQSNRRHSRTRCVTGWLGRVASRTAAPGQLNEYFRRYKNYFMPSTNFKLLSEIKVNSINICDFF
jgi:hypothetical protein